jgi:cytochrome c-type biogenesis protein CcmH/NrfF
MPNPLDILQRGASAPGIKRQNIPNPAASVAEVHPTPSSTSAAPRSSALNSSLFTLHSHLKRLAQVVVVIAATFTMLGAGNPLYRYDKLGHNLMCTCGCGEILLECNHVGCPTSGPMIQELRSLLARDLPDKEIFHWFEAKYGATALAAPIRGGFDIVAWIMPFAVLALGLTAAIWLLRHWRDRHTQTAALAGITGSAPSQTSDLRERIRRETTYEP